MSQHVSPVQADQLYLAIGAIRTSAAERDLTVSSPQMYLSQLLRAGVGGLRVPIEYGGQNSSLVAVADVLIDLAAADSNFTQILRGHLGLVEKLRLIDESPLKTGLFEKAAAGEFFGPAGAELGTRDLTTLETTLRERGGQYVLNGRKYYTTGSLYADWLNVLVTVRDTFVSVVVPADQAGVKIVDDWDGFGQRLTASGTIHFDQVEVAPENILHHSDAIANDYLEAFYQFVHSATQAGIAKAVATDAANIVRGRRRSYPLSTTPVAADDPQVLQVVGELQSTAFAARANVLLVAASLDAFSASPNRASVEQALLDSAAAQVNNTRLLGEATWHLFDSASASAVKSSLNLDRHWRNARTVSSHNPWMYKASLLGQHAVHGTLPRSFLNDAAAVEPAGPPLTTPEHQERWS